MNARVYLYIEETVIGPLGYDELVQYALDGRVDENTQACWEGSEDWGMLSQMVKMRRDESSPAEEVKIKSLAKVIGGGIKSAGFKLANLAGEKLRDISEKRAQAKLAQQTIEGFPKDLQDALNDGIFTEDEERHLRGKVEAAGLDWDTIIQTCHSAARGFVAHVLADAISDGEVSAEEEALLWRYVKIFKMESVSETISSTINRVRALQALGNNELPKPIPSEGVHWLASGEAIYVATQGVR